jgi:membrane associated rhomboid family serine protease
MIPIADKVFLFTRVKPIINYWLIGINISLFLWQLKLEVSGELSNFVSSWAVIPAQINEALSQALAGNPAAWLVLLMHMTGLLLGMFLHGSFSQILGNMIFLWVFGATLEKVIGHGRYLGFYLLCGILTGLLQILAEPGLTVPLMGANGAIASILGAYILKFPKVKIDSVLPLVFIYIPIEIPAFFYLFWWFIQQLFYGIGSLNIPSSLNQPSFAYWVHGAGLLIGAGLMRLSQGR